MVPPITTEGTVPNKRRLRPILMPEFSAPITMSTALPYLFQRFAGCTLGVLTLTLRTALLGEIARFHNRRANLAGREAHVGGVPRPGEIGSMQIAVVAGIAVELG
jgi:hypothetical protein